MDIKKHDDEELKKILSDFLKDLKITFPELEEDENLKNVVLYETKDERFINSIKIIKEHILNVLPERFFDIIYENSELYEDDEKNTNFLPGINFKELWEKNITDNTRKSIWKYLQLILFSVVTDMKNKESFGDSENLFKAIGEEDFKSKIQETMEGIQEMFNSNDMSNNQQDPSFNLPDTEKLHSHIEEMMGGKIGLLAKEIAEETSKELGLGDKEEDMEKMMKKMMKDPSTIMKLVKSVGDKLETKISSGDIKESELISEASEMMKNMKNMPGMGNIEEMMKKMGLNMSNLNKGAMQSEMGKNLKKAQQKEKLREELKKRQESKNPIQNTNSDELRELAEKNAKELIESVYKVGDGAERTKKPSENSKTKTNKKKGKKKK